MKRITSVGVIGAVCILLGGLAVGFDNPPPVANAKCPANNFAFCPPLAVNGCLPVNNGVCNGPQGNHNFTGMSQGVQFMVNDCTGPDYPMRSCPQYNFTCTKKYNAAGPDGPCSGPFINDCTADTVEVHCL